MYVAKLCEKVPSNFLEYKHLHYANIDAIEKDDGTHSSNHESSVKMQVANENSEMRSND